MDPADLVPRLIAGLAATVLMLALLGYTFFSQRSLEEQARREAEDSEPMLLEAPHSGPPRRPSAAVPSRPAPSRARASSPEEALAHAREARSAGAYQLAESRLQEAAELAAKRWLAATPDAAIWKDVPREVREDIEDEHPAEDETVLHDELQRRVNQGSYRPPESERIVALLPDLWAAWGVDDLARDREAGLERLRRVMRSPDAAAARVAHEGLRSAVRTALAAKDFAALLDLIGFTISELSIASTDPFRAELREGLEAAAQHFGAQSPRTRAFVASLMADVLAGDPAADRARAEALSMGAQLMETLPSRPEERPKVRLPSLLPGHGVMRVENATSYHLMLFFSGPETFYVRLNPMRRGIVVLKDGDYTAAVMGNTEDVVPYRGAHRFLSDVVDARYTVRQEGAGSGSWSSGISGDFFGKPALLRAAPGADRAQVERIWLQRTTEVPDDARAKALEAIRSGVGPVAGDAARELGRHKRSGEAFEALSWALKSHPDASLRYVAAEQLLHFKRRFDVSKVFEEALPASKNDQISSMLVSLAARARLPAAQRLIAAGLAGPEPALKRSMISLLGDSKRGVPAADAERLLEPLADDPQWRGAVARALSERGTPRGRALAEQMLASSDPAQRGSGAFLLHAFYRQDPRTAELLTAAESREADPRLKRSFQRFLRQPPATAPRSR